MDKETAKSCKDYLFKAQRVTDGEYVTGALLYDKDGPFTYIATVEAMDKMCVDEGNGGITTNLILTRVMKKSIEKLFE